VTGEDVVGAAAVAAWQTRIDTATKLLVALIDADAQIITACFTAGAKAPFLDEPRLLKLVDRAALVAERLIIAVAAREAARLTGRRMRSPPIPDGGAGSE
jgi:hypothetical protein